MKLVALALLALVTQDLATFSGHTREVSCIAISPDGKVLASGSADRSIKLWSPETKQATATLTGHDGEVHCVAFSPDGKLLASGEMYKRVKVWDLATQKAIQTYSDSEGAILGVVFTPDGKRVYAACKDNSARVWTVASGGEAKKLPHKYMVNGIALSPDGKVVATIDDGGSINLWSDATLKPIKSWSHASQGRAIAFSADGKTLVSGGGGVVKLWDLATGKEKASADYEVNALAISPDGSTVVIGTQDNLVVALNGSDLGEKWKVEKHDRPVTGVAIARDGKTAYTSSMDYKLRSWSLK